VGNAELGNVEQVLFNIEWCCVHPSAKVNNLTMLCGRDRATCTRHSKHQELQINADKMGHVSFYIATPNPKGAVLDAIEDTHPHIGRWHGQTEGRELPAPRGSGK
jgi:hypothetical protein